MEKIKTVVFNNFTTLFYSLLFLGTSLLLLMLRLKITNSFFLLFLVWNLFLAWIPYLISSFLLHIKNIPKFVNILGFIIWLLFLPNAPYIITDFIHLQQRSDIILWFDLFVIGSFAVSGIYGYLCSVHQMQLFLARHISETGTAFIIFCIHFLCGFGVYLGRFLRFNSWDVIQDPIGLFESIMVSIINPLAIMITICGGCMLWLLLTGYKECSKPKKD